jgi:two-component sensor histidine kinase
MEGAMGPAGTWETCEPPQASAAAWARGAAPVESPIEIPGETPHALALMAHAMSEGFALVPFGSPLGPGRALYLNPALERMIGGAGPEALERFCAAAQLDLPALGRRALEDGAPVMVDVGDPGRDVWLRLRVEPIGPGEMAVLASDRTEERRAARRHAEAFAELHHRVKNSLANAASLLKLQASSGEDANLGAALLQAANRIHAIADLHDVLYRFDSPDAVDLGLYVRDFCERLAQSLLEDGRVQLKVSTEAAIAPFEQAAPLGIILNELVTNAAKHAYPPPASGVIWVELRVEPQTLILGVADAGKGLNGKPDRPGALGMRLVRSLAKQLGGELKIESSGRGAAFELRVPRSYGGPGQADGARLV